MFDVERAADVPSALGRDLVVGPPVHVHVGLIIMIYRPPSVARRHFGEERHAGLC